mmetsp:Transcript_38450/g.53375  ORF Transcript_38450/g.53375 Transcript_38450/m.53375 type:complete len:192 (+) Transcript_38450:258-833(+)
MIFVNCVRLVLFQAIQDERAEEIRVVTSVLEAVQLSSHGWANSGIAVTQDGAYTSAAAMLARSDVSLEAVWAAVRQECGEDSSQARDIGQLLSGRVSRSGLAAAAVECYYRPYLARQDHNVEILRRDEELEIPHNLDYESVGSLSREDREKLQEFRPVSIAHAGRIPGVTPSAIFRLLKYIQKSKKIYDAN